MNTNNASTGEFCDTKKSFIERFAFILRVARTPHPAHTHKLAPTELTLARIPAGERKIPDPIIDPTTKANPPMRPT